MNWHSCIKYEKPCCNDDAFSFFIGMKRLFVFQILVSEFRKQQKKTGSDCQESEHQPDALDKAQRRTGSSRHPPPPTLTPSCPIPHLQKPLKTPCKNQKSRTP